MQSNWQAILTIYQELNHALARQAPIYARLSSYAATSDAFHITQPPPSGEGAFRGMKRALAFAQIPPSSVDYINAHATSTPLGDSAENRAIATLLCEENGMRVENVCVSSTKGATGHLLGAAGAVEALFSVLAMRDVSLSSFSASSFISNVVPDPEPSNIIEHRSSYPKSHRC